MATIVMHRGSGGSGSSSLAQITELPAGAVNGSNAVFLLSELPSDSSDVELFKNGLKQIVGAGNDYTLSGQTITFVAVAIPLAGDVLEAVYWN